MQKKSGVNTESTYQHQIGPRYAGRRRGPLNDDYCIASNGRTYRRIAEHLLEDPIVLTGSTVDCQL